MTPSAAQTAQRVLQNILTPSPTAPSVVIANRTIQTSSVSAVTSRAKPAPSPPPPLPPPSPFPPPSPSPPSYRPPSPQPPSGDFPLWGWICIGIGLLLIGGAAIARWCTTHRPPSRAQISSVERRPLPKDAARARFERVGETMKAQRRDSPPSPPSSLVKRPSVGNVVERRPLPTTGARARFERIDETAAAQWRDRPPSPPSSFVEPPSIGHAIQRRPLPKTAARARFEHIDGNDLHHASAPAAPLPSARSPRRASPAAPSSSTLPPSAAVHRGRVQERI